MIKNSVTMQELVGFLNSLCKMDNMAMEKLIAARVPCNESLANHPTVQVATYYEDAPFKVGVIGVLNGLFGSFDSGDRKGWGAIAAVWENEVGDGTLKFKILDENGCLE